MGTLIKNKNLEELRNTSSEDIEQFCIQKAKQCRAKGDSNLAKAWFLTASNLYPNSFSIMFERYLMAKEEGNLMDACRHFNEIFVNHCPSVASTNDDINQEMQKIVNAVKNGSSNPGSSFYRNLFNCFSPEAQHQLLVSVANQCQDPMESCQLMLLIMKKFPKKINEHASNILALIKKAEEQSAQVNSTQPDYFSKLLIFEILPVILSPESNLSTSIPLMLSLLDRTIEFYLHSSIIGQLVDEENQSKELNLMDKETEGKFEEVFNMFGRRLGWDLLVLEEHRAYDNFLSGVLLAHLQRIHNFYQTIVPTNIAAETDGPIDLSSSKTQIESNDENSISQVIYASFLLFVKCLQKYIKETAGKLILVEQGASYKGDPVKKRKVHFKSSSPVIVTENSELQENFIVAFQTLEFLNRDYNIQKEILPKFQATKLLDSRAYEMFKQDCQIYRGNHDECITSLEESSRTKMKSCLQLISAALMSYNYSLALKHCLTAVAMLTRVPESKEKDKSTSECSNSGGRQLFFINYSSTDILNFCIEMMIACLKDKVLLSVKPTDQGIGHLIVLTQYNWPKEVDLFLKSISTIRKPIAGSPSAPAKFVYPNFCDHIFNPDILEEFMSLVNSDGLILEIKDQGNVTSQINKFPKSSKMMTTRGVNKTAKEEIRQALANQMKRSKLILDQSVYINFILTHVKDFAGNI